MKENYYAQSLNAQKLYQVYETEYSRVRQYLAAEINFVRNYLQGTERVLELGAGYGRIVKELAPSCQSIVGIDISKDNVDFGKEYLNDTPNAHLMVMDAHNLQFQELFDVVLCLQNALSAMKVVPVEFIKKVMDLLPNGGRAFFSSYSAKFWDHRLTWFQEQSEKGLLGKIDTVKTKDGIIICEDGFRATTHSPEDMDRFGKASGFVYEVTEVDESSIFLVVTKN
ncbi:class I SAM-dependent methyltransferase [Sporomusa sphaeroides]|uniref:Bifunctional 3-demethylubiquinone-9 3-methyltransferase/ 2-octaprenyl-6-hydroxy phenol methylase n=1 Tax=Sporomusa sphaeroides DSM 2875 TaxID=1337886 RepID=A0ABP2C5L6_9FIRM|nr:class I SAM-dependent methyltransferase [Sporomusa sphaeroides]OLS56226.1 ubiquinone biosynthesis O-methyltransferase [Sporomusa sphaeroides DSM 2875]CVK19132.1 bifunctional 3-demethylubiquinone-9 3-methyltransferase/ 2-octaprenyl-6-hydroxy phenol methylase [Sporomusa sphaeroides DSM 2875]